MKKRILLALIAGAAVLVPASAMAAAPRKGVVIDFRAHSKTATVAPPEAAWLPCIRRSGLVLARSSG